MLVSRRGLFSSLQARGSGALSGALIAARGREALVGEASAAHPFEPPIVAPPEPGVIRLKSNENPLGPGQAALQALIGQLDQAGRYPFNSRQSSSGLRELIAKKFHAEPENVVLGAGSSEILRNAVRDFTSPERPLVTADPSFENPVKTAQLIGTPIRAVPVDRDFRLDLEAMAKAAQGAGLVFLCNPNNPTGTVHSARAVAAFVSRVQKDSPATAILIDEAYHEYVTARSYRTAVDLALKLPGVFVSRTFSKAFGMAGLRVGYAVGQKETIHKLSRHKLNYDVNVLAIAAATSSLNDAARLAKEKVRNTQARQVTLDYFESAGYQATDSQANFIFVNTGRSATEFREACEKRKVEVGRDFPPFEKTHSRISIGTMDEMRQAVEVFQEVLGPPLTDSGQSGK
ncbi:MAG: aminotransferase class I/II-fold pyridoxal phosphate-dependent enzyme [Acidobacteriota bacterium]